MVLRCLISNGARRLKCLLGAQKLGKTAAAWTDARLDDLAAALVPLPAEVAALRADVEHLDHVAAELEPTASEVAVVAAAVDRPHGEKPRPPPQPPAVQRPPLQIGWGPLAPPPRAPPAPPSAPVLAA